MPDLLADLEDVLLVLGATTPTDIRVSETQSPMPECEYTARSVNHPRRILPISTTVAMALLERGAVYERSVAVVAGHFVMARAV